MNKNLILILFIICFSCGKDKVVLLPEINHSEITEILDVSPAYLFYDETKKDSVELNRKNLIVTTNWLVNVDKRLTLKQVIPHIKYLQEKKKNSSHKNKNAKNYFTCNDTSRKNLGFIEFTDVKFTEKRDLDSINVNALITYKSLNSVTINFYDGHCATIHEMDMKQFVNDYEKFDFDPYKDSINISFHENLPFQNYITFKVFLQKMKKKNILISNEEFIYN